MSAETFSVVESSMLTCTLHDAAHSNFGGDFFFPLSLIPRSECTLR